MAATPTVQIIIRDEFSAQIEEIRRKLSGLGAATTAKATSEFKTLEAAAFRVGAELNSLLRMTGITGVLSGAGLAATLGGISKGLVSISRERLNLQYAAQEMGITTQQLNKLTAAGQALGQSRQQAQSSIQGVANALRDIQTYGANSSAWQQMLKAKGGFEFVAQLRETIRGPGGIEAGMRMVAERMKHFAETGNVAAIALFKQVFNLGDVRFAELFSVGPLRQPLDMSTGAMKSFMLAWTNMNISMENAKLRLAAAILPAFEKLITWLDDWLESDPGKRFLSMIEGWAKALEEVDWKKFREDMRAFFAGVKEVWDNISAWIITADAAFQRLPTWGPIIEGALVTGLGMWLLGLKGGFAALAGFAFIVPMLRSAAERAGLGLENFSADEAQRFTGGMFGGEGITHKFVPDPDFLSGSPFSTNIEDRRGEALEPFNKTRKLVQGVSETTEEFVKFNNFLETPIHLGGLGLVRGMGGGLPAALGYTGGGGRATQRFGFTGGGGGYGGSGASGDYSAPGGETNARRPFKVGENISDVPKQGFSLNDVRRSVQGTDAVIKTINGSGGPEAAVDEALKMEGLHEVRDRDLIKQYLRGGQGLDPATTAWCADFVNASLARAGIEGSRSAVATSFLRWGQGVKPGDIAKGDVLVQADGRRPGQVGGHVGMATGLTRDGLVEMISGNRSDRVRRTWESLSSVQARRAIVTDDNQSKSLAPLFAKERNGFSTRARLNVNVRAPRGAADVKASGDGAFKGNTSVSRDMAPADMEE